MTYIDPHAQLKADYADLGVSTGYIGNVYCGPERDDRSFRVFTQVEERRVLKDSLGIVFSDRWERISIIVFEAPRNAGIYRGPVEYDTPAVRERLDALRAKVAAGQARLMKVAA